MSLAVALAMAGCNMDDPGHPGELEGQGMMVNPHLGVYFNSPGWRDGTEVNRKPSEFIAERIDQANVSVYAAVYGFNKQNIIDALVRAHERGVDVRLVGDAGEYDRATPGYDKMEERKIPVQTGNQFHIMHNKFFVVDERFVYTGTGNISRSEFTFNNNHWVFFDHEGIAERFTQEFEQMFEGRFSAAKEPVDSPKHYDLGDGLEAEIWFAPQDDAMGRILEELRAVEESIHFQIFAFTKDQVASEFINRHREGKQVQGVIDRSQLHGNGQYHQGYRLLANGIDMRLDGNSNSAIPGDYQGGGGRMHTKTMFLDVDGDDPRVLTGSFNWSAAATISNDEVLVILRGDEITDLFRQEYDEIHNTAKDVSTSMCKLMYDSDELSCDHRGEVQPGDVVISEVHFDGWNAERDPSDVTGDYDERRSVSNDQFIELYNTTDRPINLSMWTITNGHDHKLGFTPGTVIGPGERFLVLDHNTVPLSEGEPQRGQHAFLNPDFVLNTANDPRFRHLDLQKSSLKLELRSTVQNEGEHDETKIIDVAGDGGPPPAGGRDGDRNYSMQRVFNDEGVPGDGQNPGSWQRPEVQEGGENVHPDFREFIIAQPGE